MSAVVQMSIFPLDKGPSLSGYVKDAVAEIEHSGLPHAVGPMGTVIEGEWGEIAALVGRCLETMGRSSERVYLTLAVDWRRGPHGRLEGKIVSLEGKLGHGVRRR